MGFKFIRKAQPAPFDNPATVEVAIPPTDKLAGPNLEEDIW